jgi:hypothetical protein
MVNFPIAAQKPLLVDSGWYHGKRRMQSRREDVHGNKRALHTMQRPYFPGSGKHWPKLPIKYRIDSFLE